MRDAPHDEPGARVVKIAVAIGFVLLLDVRRMLAAQLGPCRVRRAGDAVGIGAVAALARWHAVCQITTVEQRVAAVGRRGCRRACGWRLRGELRSDILQEGLESCWLTVHRCPEGQTWVVAGDC